MTNQANKKSSSDNRFHERFTLDGKLAPIEEAAKVLLGDDYRDGPYSLKEHKEMGVRKSLAAFALQHCKRARIALAGNYAEGAATATADAMKTAVAAGLVFEGMATEAERRRLERQWRVKGGKKSSKAANGIRIWLEETLSNAPRRTAHVPADWQGIGDVSETGVVSHEPWSNDELFNMIPEVQTDDPNAGGQYLVWRGGERVYEMDDTDHRLKTRHISRSHFNRLAAETRKKLGLPRPARGRNKG